MKFLLLIILLIPFALHAQHSATSIIEVRNLPALPSKDYSIELYINSFLETKQLTSHQKDWLYWTNYSRLNPKRFWDSIVSPLIDVYPEFQSSYSASLKKDLYSASSVPLLKPSRVLSDVAQTHSDALESIKANPSHTSPSGLTFELRMKKADIKGCAGENISFGPSNVVLALVLLYLDQGVPDLGHRRSLLNPAYTELGIGISSYPGNMFMVVQDFSCRQNF